MKKLRVTVEGKSYDVVVEVLEEHGPIDLRPVSSLNGGSAAATQTHGTAAATPVQPPAAAIAGAGDVVCPISGKLVSIEVRMGDQVQSGARLATIEAMKMFTHISAAQAGRVASIKAKPGESVEEGAILLTLV